jgi:hypothetical protein
MNNKKYYLKCHWCNKEYEVSSTKKAKSLYHYNKEGVKYYCSPECRFAARGRSKILSEKCANCGKIFKPTTKKDKRCKSINRFCCHSCAAKYNNKHKTTGNRRSKLEKWLEEKFQSKTAISYIIDKVQSLAELLLCVAEAKVSCGLDAVFVDNLEYLRDYAAEDVNHVIFILKELAVRLDIAVVVSAYSPRRTGFPIRSRIKNKYVLRTADKIAILNRPEVFATAEELASGYIVRGAAELQIIKNYTGACGFVSLKFDGTTMRFYEPENLPPEEEIDY